MKNTKTVFHIFTPWQFDNEAAELDRLSATGWQLKEVHWFRQKYVFDDTVRYRYALDLQQDTSPDYLPTFADQGWTLIDSCADRGSYRNADKRWYFFRKEYDPALPEEAYEIYTDGPSFEEMKKRWRVGFWAWLVIMAIWFGEFILNPSLTQLCCCMAWLSMLLLWSLRKMRLVRARSGRETPRRRMSFWLIGLLPLFFVAMIFVSSNSHSRLYSNASWSGPAGEIPQTVEFTVTLPDWYTLLAYANENVGTFRLTNEAGKTLAYGPLTAGRSYEDTQYDLFLWPGTYTITTDTQAGAVPGAPPSPARGEIMYQLN